MSERTLKWHGRVKNGKLDLFAKDAFRKYIRTSLEGREVELVVQPREKETTWPQYRFLFGCLLPLLAGFMGESIEAAEYIVKERWHSEKKMIFNPDTGEEKEVIIPLSFSRGKISRKKFAHVIDKVEILLDSLNIKYPAIENWQNEVPEITE